MPIRRELRPLYPANWKDISHRVRFVRARGRCEACGRPHAELIRCLPDGRWFDPAQQTWRDRRGRNAPWPDLLTLIGERQTRIILAAAHLDHDPRHNRMRNLKSLCQRCHLAHDAPYHRAQRWITCRNRYAAGDLFLGAYRHQAAGDGDTEARAKPDAWLALPIVVMRALAARRPAGELASPLRQPRAERWSCRLCYASRGSGSSSSAPSRASRRMSMLRTVAGRPSIGWTLWSWLAPKGSVITSWGECEAW